MLALSEEMGDMEAKIQTLQLYLPGSVFYDCIHHLDIVSPASIWRECCEIEESRMKEYIAKEINLRRTRLGADPIEFIKATVEQEAFEKYNIQNYYEMYLNLDLDEDENIAAAIKYLDILDRAILYADREEKFTMRETIHELCNSLMNCNAFSDTACRIEMNEQNCFTKDMKLERVSKFQSRLRQEESPMGDYLEAYGQWKTQDLEGALVLLSESLEKSPCIFAFRLLLVVYHEQSDWESLIQTWSSFEKYLEGIAASRALELDQVLLEADLLVAKAYLKTASQNSTQCLVKYKSILKSNPNLVEGLYGLGCILLEIGRYADAKSEFEKILDLEPENAEAILELGWTMHKLGKHQEALDYFVKTGQTETNYLVRYRIAVVYWEMGEPYRSDKDYCHYSLVEAIKMNPHFSQSFTYLGHFYFRHESDLERAAKCYSKAVSINPTDQDAVQALVEIWISRERIQEAKDLLLQFSIVSPRSSWVWKQLGILFIEAQPETAITQFQTSLRLQPNDPICWSALGEAYSNAGKYVAALKTLDRALGLDSEYFDIYYQKGLVYQKLGMFVDSVSNLELYLQYADEKLHFPVLHALAETSILFGSDLFEQGFYYGALEQYLKCIELCGRAVNMDERRYISVLKFIADACIHCYKQIRNLVTDEHLEKILELLQLLKSKYESLFDNMEIAFEGSALEKLLIFSYYCYKLCLIQSNVQSLRTSLYRDMASTLYFLQNIRNQESQDLWNLATQYCKTSLSYDPTNSLTWNTLGILVYRRDPQLAQHSFIQAVSYDESVM
jgi:superkiller protein 3